jgi:hypothetical protein
MRFIAFAVLATSALTGTVYGQTAPPGYHYELGSNTPTPNDPCWRDETELLERDLKRSSSGASEACANDLERHV